MAYAEGVIDNQFQFYIRDDGLLWHPTQELPASARMLTILSLYHSYNGAAASGFLLRHFEKAKTLAGFLLARHAASLQYGSADPRYGIPAGGDDALHSAQPLSDLQQGTAEPPHWYATAAELYRACVEMGKVWATIGTLTLTLTLIGRSGPPSGRPRVGPMSRPMGPN
jgi:hypothetical protein